MEKITELEQEQYNKYGELVQACRELPKLEAEAKIHQLLSDGVIPNNIKWTKNNSRMSCIERIVANLNLSEDQKITWLKLFSEKDADLHIVTWNGTLLHTALIHNCQKVADFLLREKGFDINGRNPFNHDTALHQQARYTGEQIKSKINFLLAHGANPFLTNKRGKTPREVAEFDDVRQLLQAAEEKQQATESAYSENTKTNSSTIALSSENFPQPSTLRHRHPIVIVSEVQNKTSSSKKTSKSASSKSTNLLDTCIGFFFKRKGYQRISSETNMASPRPKPNQS